MICVQTAIENINSRFPYTIEFQMVGYAVRNVPKYDSISERPNKQIATNSAVFHVWLALNCCLRRLNLMIAPLCRNSQK